MSYLIYFNYSIKTSIYFKIPDQSDTNEDDEPSIMCCKSLAESYNFTSHICSHLFNYFLTDSKKNIKSLLNEKSSRLAFIVLNKLTLDNKILSIDIYVTQFIQFAIQKIFEDTELKGGSTQNYLIQFLSNAICNNKSELEALLHSIDCYYGFCRKLLKIISENSNTHFCLNSLIILVTLMFDNPVLGISKTSNAIVNIIKYIDLALNLLYENGDKTASDQSRMNNVLLFQKSNALNFLMEMFKQQTVVNALEM